MHLLGRTGLPAADFIGEAFVIADIEPFFLTIGGPGLEHPMEFFDQGLCQFVLGVVDDEVDATEVVGGLHDVVHVECLPVGDSDGVGFEDEPGLLVGEATAFDMVGVVGQIDLGAVVDAAAHLAFFLFAETLQEGRAFPFMDVVPGGYGVNRDAPGLAGEEGTVNLAGGAPVARRPHGDFMPFGEFGDGDVFHTLWFYRQESL